MRLAFSTTRRFRFSAGGRLSCRCGSFVTTIRSSWTLSSFMRSSLSINLFLACKNDGCSSVFRIIAITFSTRWPLPCPGSTSASLYSAGTSSALDKTRKFWPECSSPSCSPYYSAGRGRTLAVAVRLVISGTDGHCWGQFWVVMWTWFGR